MTFLVDKENSDDFYWEIKTWEASTREMRTRIFVLLGNNSLWGECLFSQIILKSLGYIPIYWGFKNENLQSVKGIRRLGVCQYSGVNILGWG